MFVVHFLSFFEAQETAALESKRRFASADVLRHYVNLLASVITNVHQIQSLLDFLAHIENIFFRPKRLKDLITLISVSQLRETPPFFQEAAPADEVDRCLLILI